MCRFLAYKGPPLRLAEVVTEAEQSLIRQSFAARERSEPLNGDGFGVGWYTTDDAHEPGAFTSLSPAWSNRNLRRLAASISSGCFFAHVRAATIGLAVTELNCHPFVQDRFLWMHNGEVPRFRQMKRTVQQSLSDEAFHSIEGTTDSEHAFALFLDRLRPRLQRYDTADLARTLVETIAQLEAWRAEHAIAEPGYYNFAVTDGHSLVVSRHASHGTPLSLYLCRGERMETIDGRCRMRPAAGAPRAVVVASEPLADHPEDWQPVPPGHLVVVTPEMHLELQPIAAA